MLLVTRREESSYKKWKEPMRASMGAAKTEAELKSWQWKAVGKAGDQRQATCSWPSQAAKSLGFSSSMGGEGGYKNRRGSPLFCCRRRAGRKDTLLTRFYNCLRLLGKPISL